MTIQRLIFFSLKTLAKYKRKFHNACCPHFNTHELIALGFLIMLHILCKLSHDRFLPNTASISNFFGKELILLFTESNNRSTKVHKLLGTPVTLWSHTKGWTEQTIQLHARLNFHHIRGQGLKFSLESLWLCLDKENIYYYPHVTSLIKWFYSMFILKIC